MGVGVEATVEPFAQPVPVCPRCLSAERGPDDFSLPNLRAVVRPIEKTLDAVV